MSGYSGPKGTYDVFPGGREPHERAELWAFVEGAAREFFRRYNYSEVRTPIFEEAQLFVRSAGEASDIVVKKEMFTFRDMGGRELAMSSVTASIGHAQDHQHRLHWASCCSRL